MTLRPIDIVLAATTVRLELQKLLSSASSDDFKDNWTDELSQLSSMAEELEELASRCYHTKH